MKTSEIPDNIKEEIINLYTKDRTLTQADLAVQFNIHYVNVHKILVKANIIRKGRQFISDEIIAQAKEMYLTEKLTVVAIAQRFRVKPKNLVYALKKENVTIRRTTNNANRKLSEKTRTKISNKLKGTSHLKGVKHSVTAVINNLRRQNHIPTEFENFFRFAEENLDKLKFVCTWLKNVPDSTECKIQFIEKFYFDPNFNLIYQTWLNSNKNKWYRPTLDHIIPVSKGGPDELSNFQILTWFENRAKAEMTQIEWEEFKIKTNTKSSLFIG